MIITDLKIGDKFMLAKQIVIHGRALKHVFEYRGEYKISDLCDQVRAKVKPPWMDEFCYWDLDTKVIPYQKSLF